MTKKTCWTSGSEIVLGVALESSLNHPRQILIQLDEALVLIATEMYFESGMVVEQ